MWLHDCVCQRHLNGISRRRSYREAAVDLRAASRPMSRRDTFTALLPMRLASLLLQVILEISRLWCSGNTAASQASITSSSLVRRSPRRGTTGPAIAERAIEKWVLMGKFQATSTAESVGPERLGEMFLRYSLWRRPAIPSLEMLLDRIEQPLACVVRFRMHAGTV